MLTPVEMVLFLLAVVVSLYLAQRPFRQAAAIIYRGEGQLTTDDLPRRLWRAVEVAVTQRTVLRSRVGTSIMHAFIVWGFLFYFLVNAGDVLEGYFDVRFLGDGLLGGLYRFIADVFSALVLVGMSYFLVRRFGVKSPALAFHDNVKLHERVQPGIRRDSLIVGVFILVHVGARFLGRSFWIANEWGDAWQPFAGLVARLWDGLDTDTLITLEHLMWWLGLGAILAFIPYFPYTKHMHLFMGPLNYFTKPERTSPGALHPLDFEDDEREQFGAARLEHLQKTHLFDAFACIMCNRCQDVCPAYVTGKELSPAALEVNKRYEIKANMSLLASGAESPRPLLDFAITPSAVWACTSCGACVDICPVGNEPMFDLMDIRRNQVLVDGDFPAELQGAFKGMENSGNPWQLSQSRMQWASGLDVPTVDEVEEYEILYWVGCAASLEPRAQQTARALVRVLHAAGVRFAVLGERERCTGDSARRAGNEYLFYEMAMANIETLNEARPPRILVTCPHCLHTLGKEYGQFGGHYDVVHHTEYLDELIRDHRLAPGSTRSPNVTFHDPCYLGRQNGVLDAPRRVLEQVTGGPLIEMERSGKKSFCCGAGGAQFWKEEEPGTARVNLTRYAEAKDTGAATLAVGCPFCMRMLTDASNDATGAGGPQVKDVVEILAAQMGIEA